MFAQSETRNQDPENMYPKKRNSKKRDIQNQDLEYQDTKKLLPQNPLVLKPFILLISPSRYFSILTIRIDMCMCKNKTIFLF